MSSTRYKALVQSSVSVESYRHEIETDTDQTGSIIRYAFIAGGEPSSWTNGSWSGTWDSVTKKATGVTPTVGGTGTGANVELADGRYDCWVQIVGGSEQPVRRFDSLVIT